MFKNNAFKMDSKKTKKDNHIFWICNQIHGFIPTRFHNPLGALGRRSLTWTGSRSSPEISPGTSMEEACGDTALQRQQGSLQPILGSMDDVGISVYILYIYICMYVM